MRFCAGINWKLGSGVGADVVVARGPHLGIEDVLIDDYVRAKLREHRERSPMTAPGSDALSLTDVDVESDEDDGDDDRDHVVCTCRPRVTLCGRYTEEPVGRGAWYASDPKICRDCAEASAQPCPSCGCRWDEGCRRCATRGERLIIALRRLWPWS